MSNFDSKGYLQEYVDCPACDGDKAIHHKDGGYACDYCDATGKVTREEATKYRFKNIPGMSNTEFQKLWG
jgi:hypothetical protein